MDCMEFHLLIFGDLLPTENNELEFETGAVRKIFGSFICESVSHADYAIANLEGAITDSNNPIRKSGPSIKAPILSIEGIKKLGISCVCLANNHVMDYGVEGLFDTVSTLKKNCIQYIGAGENAHSINAFLKTDIGHNRIVIYNVADTEFNIPKSDYPGVNIFEEFRVCREIERLKKECDYLIVLYHGGAEKFRYPTPKLRKRFRLIADCGADLVIAQHSHCIGCQEKYKESILLYGQGNFCFARANDEYTSSGLIVDVVFSDNAFKKVVYTKIKRKDAFIEIDKEQDLSDFWERSEKCLDDKYIEREYIDYCRGKIDWYLSLFKRTDPLDRVLSKVFYKNSNIRREKYLLAAINMMRCEVHHENFETSLIDLYQQLYGKDI